jgi:autotransporter translocation and assembly factor TamB
MAGMVALLILLLIGLVGYSRTAHFQQVVHDQLLSALRTSLDAEVSLEEVRGMVWRGVEIRNLSIRQDGLEMVSLKRGIVSVDVVSQLVSALRSGSLKVAEVTLTDPVIRLVQDPKTGWNVARLVKPSDQSHAQPQKEPLPVSVLLPRVTIENGQVSARLADGKEFQVTGLTLDTDVALLPLGMRATINNLSFAASGARVPTVQWSSRLAYEEEANGVRNASLTSVDVRTAQSRLQLAGTVKDLAAPSLDFTMTVDKLAADELARFFPPRILKQDLAGKIHIAGPLSALRIETALETRNGHLASTVTANLAQSPPDAQGALTLDRFVINEVLQIPGVEVAGEVTGEVKFQGTNPETLQAEVAAYVEKLAASGSQVGDVNVTANMKGKQVAFFTEVQGQAGYLYSQGQVILGDPLTYETNAMVRGLNARQVTGENTTPETNVNVDAWVKGSGTKPEAMQSEVKLTFAPSRVGPTVISQGEFVGAFKDGRLVLNKGMLLANDATVNMQGELNTGAKTTRSNLTYDIMVKNLTPWLALAGIEGKGAFELNGTAAGVLTALRVDGRLSLDQVRVGATAVQEGLVAYQLADLGGVQPRGHATAVIAGVQAGMPLKTVNAEVSFVGLQSADIQAEVTVTDAESRSHHLKTQARYTPTQVDAVIQDLAIQLPTGIWKTPQPPRLTLHGNALTIENFALERAGQSVRVAGTFDPHGSLRMQLQVERLALEEFRPVLGDALEVKGQVNVEVQVQGTGAQPEMTVDVTTGPLTVAGQTYAGLTSQSTYRKEQLRLNLLLKQDETHALRIDGGLPIALPTGGESSAPILGEAALRVHSDGLSLAFLAVLSRDLKEVRGAITMDVSLKGPVQALAPSGSVRLQNGHAWVKQLGQAFSDINMEIQLDPNTVRLTELSVQGGKGQFTGKGTVALEHYAVGNIDLAFHAEHFRVIDTKEYRSELTGELTCAGSLEAPRVTGSMAVVETTARLNIALMKSGPAAQDPTITVVRSAEEVVPSSPKERLDEGARTGAAETAPKGDLYDKLALDVGVTIPRNTWVHMAEGSIELMGQIHARKKPTEELTLHGAIETVRGWLAVQGRKFKLEKGNISFAGETPIDPSLDIIARYTLPEYLVDVVISGTGAKPVVSFKSDPALEQADILSLLVFGKPANALNDKEKVSLQSQALQAVAGSVASDLRQAVAEQLGVDNLELDVGEDPSHSKVGIGKYIAPGVFVSTSQQLGGGNTQGQGRDVTIEYQLDDDWQLKASTTARGNNGVDILWKKKY